MRQITVRGTGTTAVRPDTVELGFTLHTERAVYAETAAAAAEASDKLRAAVVRAGLSDKALKTAAFSLNAKYDTVPDGKGGHTRVFAGYVCTERLTLRFPLDMALLDKVLGETGESGAAAEFTVRFTRRQERAVKDALIKAAVRDAAHKAAVLAEAAGETLGALVAIEYGASPVNLYSRTEFSRDSNPKVRAAAAFAFTPEDIENTDTVTAVYELL